MTSPAPTVEETLTNFRWERFTSTYVVDRPNLAGPYELSISAELDVDGDEDGLQVWKVTVELPLIADRVTTITRTLRCPGWREAVAFSDEHGPALANAAVDAYDRRLVFNQRIRDWTAGATPNALDRLSPLEASENLAPVHHDPGRLRTLDTP